MSKERRLLDILRDMRKLAVSIREPSVQGWEREDITLQAENLLIETIVLMQKKPTITRERIRIITDEIIHRYKEVKVIQPIPIGES